MLYSLIDTGNIPTFLLIEMGGKKAGAGGKEKKKKPPKEKKETEGVLPAVDKQFYELTINDLNQKLTRLRGHNNRVELQLEELEGKLKQVLEDKADIVTYLNRELKQKVDIIRELEEKLTELNNVREDENRLSKKHYKELEAKAKASEEQLTSEIKLLTGKLNSLEEFRIQRSDLMAKFEAQEAQLKDQTKRHDEKLYEIEKSNIIGKDLLKREVEQRLLKLSNDFTKSRDLRVASHVQRLVRENICLDNEIERMFVTHQRLEKENAKHKAVAREAFKQQKVDKVEIERLIRTGQTQVQIIEALTTKLEEQLEENEKLQKLARKHEKAMAKLEANETSQELREEIQGLEARIERINKNRKNLRLFAIRNRKDLDQIMGELNRFKFTLNEIILMDSDGKSRDDNKMRRESLLNDLMATLATIENTPLMDSVENILRINRIYNQGEIGFVPHYDLDNGDQTEIGDLADLAAVARRELMNESVDDDGDDDESAAATTVEDPIIDVQVDDDDAADGDADLERRNSGAS